MSSFKKNPVVEAELARSPAMGVPLKTKVQAAVSVAKAIAPVESGDYRDSLEGDVFFDPTYRSLVGRVVAKDFKANWIEFGTATGFPAHAVLRKAVTAVGMKLRPTR